MARPPRARPARAPSPEPATRAGLAATGPAARLLLGARAAIASGPKPVGWPIVGAGARAPISGTVARAAISALARKGAQPATPVSDSSSGPSPKPTDTEAA